MPEQPVISGKYEVTRVVGKGGMGTVYQVRHRGLQRVLALKMLPRELAENPEFVRRFQREAQVLAQLSHPNIVRVFDFDAGGDRDYYLVMEFLQGENLRQLLNERGAFPLADVLRIGTQIASALAYAHAQTPAVVHRDIKPSNILIEDGTGRVVVTDFGIAHLVDDDPGDSTQTGTFIGTMRYSAPEQLENARDVDGRADVYSLGLVLYELYAGKQFFADLNPNQIMMRVFSKQENTVDLPSAAPGFAELIVRAIARDRTQRHPTAAALLEDLQTLEARLGRAAGQAAASATMTADRRDESDDPTADLPTAANLGSLLRRVAATLGGLFSKRRRAVASPAGRSQEAEQTPPRLGKPAGGDTDTAQSSESTVIFATKPAPPAEATSATGSQPAATPPHVPPADVTSAIPVRLLGKPVTDQTIGVALVVASSADAQHVGKRVPMARFPFAVGRQAELSLSFDPAISARHAEIDYENGRFTIRDLDSVNGTFVNGRRLPRGQFEPLFFGAHVLLGSNTELIFVSDLLTELPDMAGEELAGRFQLEEKLHASAKAVLYKAQDHKLMRTVVVKVLAPRLASHPGYREQFEREARLASGLTHSSICCVLDYGIAVLPTTLFNESLYVCMEFMEGGNLSRRIAEGQPFDARQVAAWLDPIGDALDYVHSKKIVHGSIKPSAIVFDASGHPYLTDFALATMSGEKGQRTVLGAPAFVAPEEWLGEEPSPASDQYSLAVVTYRLVAGALPYEGQDRWEVREQNFLRGPIAAHTMAAKNQYPPLPELVSEVLARALSTDRSTRYPSVKEFAHAFHSALISGTGPRRPSVFMSYHRKASSPWALYLKRELEQEHDCQVFVDVEQRDTAGRFPVKLEKRVLECDVFVCLVADTTFASDWVQREIDLAVRARKPMIPVFQESFQFPSDLTVLAPAVQELLAFDGIKLLDLQNIYVDAAVRRLADSITNLLSRRDSVR